MRLGLYKELAAELKQISDLKWVDWDFGQLTQPTDQYPVPFPCVLISFGHFSYSDLLGRVQEGEATIYIDLYLRRAGDVQASAPKQETILEGLQLLDVISGRLHARWSSEQIQELHRRGESPINTPPDLIAVRQTYEARIIDCQMATDPEKHKVRLAPQANIKQ